MAWSSFQDWYETVGPTPAGWTFLGNGRFVFQAFSAPHDSNATDVVAKTITQTMPFPVNMRMTAGVGFDVYPTELRLGGTVFPYNFQWTTLWAPGMSQTFALNNYSDAEDFFVPFQNFGAGYVEFDLELEFGAPVLETSFWTEYRTTREFQV